MNRIHRSAALLVSLAFSDPLFALPYRVSIDTSPLSGTAAQVAFDFIDGGPPTNSVVISDFATDGALGGASTAGDVTGNLSGLLMLGNASFFSEYLAPITLGNAISFIFVISQSPPAAGSLPDAFALFLLDPGGAPLLATSDPAGAGALLVHGVDGTPAGDLVTYSDLSAGRAPVTIAISTDSPVPVPATLWLLAAALLPQFRARSAPGIHPN